MCRSCSYRSCFGGGLGTDGHGYSYPQTGYICITDPPGHGQSGPVSGRGRAWSSRIRRSGTGIGSMALASAPRSLRTVIPGIQLPFRLIQVGPVCSAVRSVAATGKSTWTRTSAAADRPGAFSSASPRWPVPRPRCQPPRRRPRSRDAARWDIDADWWGPAWDVVTSASAEPAVGADLTPAARRRTRRRPLAAPGAAAGRRIRPGGRSCPPRSALWLSRRRPGVSLAARRPGSPRPGRLLVAGVPTAPPDRLGFGLGSRAGCCGRDAQRRGAGRRGRHGRPDRGQRLVGLRPAAARQAVTRGHPVGPDRSPPVWQPAVQPAPRPV